MNQARNQTSRSHKEISRRPLGLVPASFRGRLFWAWALGTFILTMLPVFDVIANSSRMIGGVLPATILWSYAVFALVNVLAIVIYVSVGREWAERVDADEELVQRQHKTSRREQVLLDMQEHSHRHAKEDGQ